MPKILLPTGLYGQSGGRETIEVGGTTLDEALAALIECCPDITKHLFRPPAGDGTVRAPELRSYVRAFIGDTDSRSLLGGATPVDDETEIRIVPSIAGGAPSNSAAAPLSLDPEKIELSQEEILRYSRHLIMPEVAIDGQKRLKAASVLCIGTGGLGSPLVLYLAAAGVGRIGLVDFDNRRPDQPAAPDRAWHAGCRTAQSRLGEGQARRPEPGDHHRDAQHDDHQRQRA